MGNGSSGKKILEIEAEKVNAAIRNACARNFGVIDTAFLCQPVAVLNPHKPHCVKVNASIDAVMSLLKAHRVGCVVIVDGDERVSGIFSERDYILKVHGSGLDCLSTSIEHVMTRNPVTEKIDTTIAFALNLMSQGGFRHLPLVDDDGVIVGIISVKDVVDHIVGSFVSDLLAMPILDLQHGVTS